MPMTDYSLYRKRIGINGETLRESNVGLFKSQYQSLAKNSNSYKTVNIDESDEQTGALIISKQVENQKTITIVDDGVEINLGSKVVWNGTSWIVIEKSIDEDVYIRGVIQQCNYILNFQIGDSEIYCEPCIIDDKTTLNTGTKDGKVVTIPDTRKVVYIQFNKNTSKLRIGNRLFIDALYEDAKVYKITDIDRVTKMQSGKGIWVLKCDEDAVNKNTDRPDLLIADYIAPNDIDPAPSPTDCKCEIAYSGNPEIKAGGSTKTFTAVFYNETGNEISDIEAVWSISDSYGGSVQIKEQFGDFNEKVKIQVANGNGLAGKGFELVLNDALGLYESRLNVRMVGLY